MKLRPSSLRSHTPPIDLTAMVDVVFLLIIFFLTTSSLIEVTRERLKLPEETGEENATTESPGLIVNVLEDGRYVVDRTVVSLSQLMGMIRQEVSKAGGDPSSIDLLIRADREAALSYVNEIADGLASLGVRRWRLGTQLPTGESLP